MHRFSPEISLARVVAAGAAVGALTMACYEASSTQPQVAPIVRYIDGGSLDLIPNPNVRFPATPTEAVARATFPILAARAESIPASTPEPALASMPDEDLEPLPEGHDPNLVSFYMNDGADCVNSPTRVFSQANKLRQLASNIFDAVNPMARSAYAEALNAIPKPEELLTCMVDIESKRPFLTSQSKAREHGFTPIEVDTLKPENIVGFETFGDWRTKLVAGLQKIRPEVTQADVNAILSSIRFTYKDPVTNEVGVFVPLWFEKKEDMQRAKDSGIKRARWVGELLAVVHDPKTGQIVIIEENQDLNSTCDNESVPIPLKRLPKPAVEVTLTATPAPDTATPVPTITTKPLATLTPTNSPVPQGNVAPPAPVVPTATPGPENRPVLPTAAPIVPTSAPVQPTAVPSRIAPQGPESTPTVGVGPTKAAPTVSAEQGTPSVHMTPRIQPQGTEATPVKGIPPTKAAPRVAPEQGTPSGNYVESVNKPKIPDPPKPAASPVTKPNAVSVKPGTNVVAPSSAKPNNAAPGGRISPSGR